MIINIKIKNNKLIFLKFKKKSDNHNFEMKNKSLFITKKSRKLWQYTTTFIIIFASQNIFIIVFIYL